MANKVDKESIGALAGLDEALHWLRESGSGLLGYYLGTAPFCVAFLYYWMNMSRGADAWRSHESGALILTLLFFWMKAWQARFASNLRRRMDGLPPLDFSWKRWLRRLRNQSVFQGLGVALLPAAIVTILPIGWVYAWLQNLSALDEGNDEGLGDLARRAKAEALRWPAQNHVALILSVLAMAVVYINLLALGLALPLLMKTLMGIETVFSRSPWAYFNSTTFLAVAASTYLLTDPLRRAFYALRCHHGGSIRTGADLRNRLRMAVDQAKQRSVA